MLSKVMIINSYFQLLYQKKDNFKGCFTYLQSNGWIQSVNQNERSWKIEKNSNYLFIIHLNFLTLNDKVNNYTDLLLNVDGEVFTCKVLASTDTDALAKEYESIVKNNPSDVETFLDELMNEGVIAFYMTGIPQKRSIEDDFEQFEDETGTVLRLK